MGALNNLWRQVASMFGARPIEEELAAEMRVHLERMIAYNRRAGLSPEEAAREAHRRLGGAWVNPRQPHIVPTARHRAA
jgi:1,2-phenylacetyl-CoA epoxidase catalytic subunit